MKREIPTVEEIKGALLGMGNVLEEAEGIGLFGSFARGKANERSDIDVFVVIDDAKDSKDIDEIWIRRIRETLRKFKRDVTVIVYTMSLLKKICNWYVLRLASDGIIVYGKEGKVRDMFDKILKAADEAGLCQVKRGDTWIWTTKKPLEPGQRIFVEVRNE